MSRVSGLFDFRPYATKHKGEDVTMEVRPLKTKEMAIALSFSMTMQQNKDAIKVEKLEDGTKKITIGSPEAIKTMYDFQTQSLPVVSNAVRNLEGTPDDDWTVICEQSYYLPLVLDIMTHLMKITQLSEGDEKN